MKNLIKLTVLFLLIGISATSCKKDKTTIEEPQIQISAGDYYSLVLKTDNSLWACGGDNNGQLGDGTSTDRNTLVPVFLP